MAGTLILFLLVLGVMLAVLELNKNTVWGFALALLIAGGYLLLRLTVLKSAPFSIRLAALIMWLMLFGCVLRLTRPPLKREPVTGNKHPEKTGVIDAPCGSVRGVYSDDGLVEVYAAIPYAKPPIGELRWREPEPAEKWRGVLENDSFAPMGIQPVYQNILGSLRQILGFHDYKITLKDNYLPAQSEDSLYLNVWKPKGEVKNLPVLVYIHGGSLKSGQSWYYDCRGEGLSREGIIVVTISYRLGAFGFLALDELAEESPNGSTGNYGLADQILALKWISRNISAFGGDPDNVTLAGESSGAACVSALSTSPLAKGLFRRAILESSVVVCKKPPHSYRTMDEALASGKRLMQKYGCSDLSELRAIPAEKLAADSKTEHHITVDGYYLPEAPYESYKKGVHNEEAALHGCNSLECGPFVVFDRANKRNYEKKVRAAFGDIADEVLALYPSENDKQAKENWGLLWGAVFFYYPHYRFNRTASEKGTKLYQYYFTKENGRLGPWHSGEEMYFYGNIPEESRLFDSSDRGLQKKMVGYFVNFCTYGDPNGAGPEEWSMNGSSLDIMELGENAGMIKETRLALFELFDKKYGV